MNEFVSTVLPGIAVVIVLVLHAFNYIAKARATGDKQKYENHMLECMCIGMVLGLAFGGNGIAYGMFIGTIVGMFFKKTHKYENQ